MFCNSKNQLSVEIMDVSESHEESESNERRDRLSELPDPLILEILSLLHMSDVVRTTLLSKRWNGLWTTVPCLSFFNVSSDRFDEFRDFVNGAISLWKGTKILKLTLVFMFDLSLSTHLDSWLRFAMEKQVEELCLDMISFHTGRKHNSPQLLYSCSSITKLTLVSCNLKIEENVKWNLLQSLVIRDADSLSENSMDHILSGAPRLEVLELQVRVTSRNLNIRSSGLKSVKIESLVSDEEANESMLRICAPNLESLEISGVPCGRCLLSVPSLTKVILRFYQQHLFKTPRYFGDQLLEGTLRQVFLSLLHVEKITLSYWCIKLLFEMKKDMLISFSKAKFLKLYADASDEILGVVEMFPGLMVLVVEGNGLISLMNSNFDNCCNHFYSNIAEDASVKKFGSCNSLEPSPSLMHLRTVEVSWYMRDTSIFRFIEIMLENAKMLEKMVFWARTFGPNPELLSVAEKMVLCMPRASPTAEVIIRR